MCPNILLGYKMNNIYIIMMLPIFFPGFQLLSLNLTGSTYTWILSQDRILKEVTVDSET